MTEYLLLFVGTVLVNNFVLVKFLGLCPLWASLKTGNRHWYGSGDHFRADIGIGLRLDGQ